MIQSMSCVRRRILPSILAGLSSVIPAASAASLASSCNDGGPEAVVGRQHVLRVIGGGAGEGTVISTPAGISCSYTGGGSTGACMHEFAAGARVELRQSPYAGGVFAGWDGSGCATGVCELTLTRDQTVSATFSPLDSIRWVAFAPTRFDPPLGIFPDESGLRRDLERLAEAGFDGVVTFAADGTLDRVPRLARELGFRGVIMGLFILNDAQRAEEMRNAVAAAAWVDGYAVGNEGLIGCGGSSYGQARLLATMNELRSTTGRPTTTSEQIEDYLDGGTCGEFLLHNGDWLFPIVHPFNNGIRGPVAGVAFVADRVRALQALGGGRTCVKETGWPTGGDPAATEANQSAYFVGLKGQSVCFGYFEYADQPWKLGTPWEAFWGLFAADGSAKMFIHANRP